jgi:transcription termination factor NusB
MKLDSCNPIGLKVQPPFCWITAHAKIQTLVVTFHDLFLLHALMQMNGVLEKVPSLEGTLCHESSALTNRPISNLKFLYKNILKISFGNACFQKERRRQ